MTKQDFEGHTEGPLMIKRAVQSSDGGFDYAILDSNGFCIAEAFDVIEEGKTANAHANARLIAAAPDLLRERDELIHDVGEYIKISSELATENVSLCEALKTLITQIEVHEGYALSGDVFTCLRLIATNALKETSHE